VVAKTEGIANTSPLRRRPPRPGPGPRDISCQTQTPAARGAAATAHCGGRLRLIATLHDPAINRKILPTSFSDAREQVVYEAAMALAGGRLVPQGLYDRAVTVLGHETVTDMVVLMGYYTAVALTMNFYAVPAGSPGLAR
jgi:hypothetical protein